ncbi:hypothetical protein LNV08_01410 [Paucibacter sp. TC2R-5]|uniref:hypothetical protein n=1 Tax=Paucibacter sp. TC2R-5 TaxID=2893555 RepID=UPI0021E3CE64|nr:hypothetical protein [Paucibacter sp. TC2R-5]MCV2357627.1 hypothetical protein [Paucibacter sp. TC2R-5]
MMILNLTDPDSIVSWWKVLPERHGPQLQAIARLRPQFALPIRAAWRRIKADPELRPLLAESRSVANEILAAAPTRHYKDDPADALLAA